MHTLRSLRSHYLRSTSVTGSVCNLVTPYVDMYNVTDGSVYKQWEYLTVERQLLAAAYANGVVVFAGGANSDLFTYVARTLTSSLAH